MTTFGSTPTDLLLWGIVAHLVADWLLQTDWMAVNKVHPFKSAAAWVHATIHVVCLAAVFPVATALILGWVHLYVDTRTPLVALRSLLGQAKEDNPFRDHVLIWHDQAVHIICIAVAALVVGGTS